MKTLLPVIATTILSFISAQTGNPLKNTEWEAPNGLVIYFTKSDTVKLMMNDQLITAALYKVRDSFVIWRDFLKSDASCDTSIRGTYVYNIKDSLLSFRVISDRCEERGNVIQTLVLSRK